MESSSFNADGLKEVKVEPYVTVKTQMKKEPAVKNDAN